MTNIIKLFTCLLVLSAGTAQAGLEWSFGTTAVNPDGANTASAIIKVMPDADQLAAAGQIDDPTLLSFNISVGMFGDIATEQATIIVTPLVDPGTSLWTSTFGNTISPPGGTSPWIPDANGNGTQRFTGVQNGSEFAAAFLNPGALTFAEQFDSVNMLEVIRLDISLGDGFEQDVDVSEITLTITDGAGTATRTQFGEIGDPIRAADDPLYAADFTNIDGLTTTLSVVPEPSSMAYLGLCLVCVTGVRWYRRRKQA